MSKDNSASFKVGIESEQTKGSTKKTNGNVNRLEGSSTQMIPNGTYTATNTTEDEVRTEQAIAFIHELRTREQNNKETLRKLRELNENETRRKVIVQTNLRSIRKDNCKLKKENEDVEKQVKDAVNELNNIQEQDVDADSGRVNLTNKIFNAKGKLKKDNSLASALNDMLNYLENTVSADQQYVELKDNEWKRIQKQLIHQSKDYEDKIEQRKELKNEAELVRKLLKELENDVRDWLKELNNLTKHKPEKMDADVIGSYNAAIERIIQLAGVCKANNKSLIELRDHLKDSQNRTSEIADSNKQNETLMKQIDQIPNTFYNMVSNAVESRDNVSLPPHPAGTGTDSSSEYLNVLYKWGDNERNQFADKLKQMAAAIDETNGKCAKNEDQRKKESSDVDDDLDKLEKEESYLFSENDKLQADNDDRNAREFMSTKKKVKSLEKILLETAIFVENRQKALGVNQKQIEETIECEETETRDNEIVLQTLRRKKARLEDDNERMEKESEYMENRMKSKKTLNVEEHQALTAELARLKSKENEQDQKIKAAHDLIKDNQRWEAELEEINQRYENKEKELEVIEEEVRKKFELNERLTNELKVLDEECQNMKTTLHALQKANKNKENRIAREKLTLHEMKCELENEESKSIASKSVASEEQQKESQRLKDEQRKFASAKQQVEREDQHEKAEGLKGDFEPPLKGMKTKQRSRRRSRSAKSYVDVYETHGDEIQVELPERSPRRTHIGAESAVQSMPTSATEPSEAKMQQAFTPRAKPHRKQPRSIAGKTEYVQGEIMKSAEIRTTPEESKQSAALEDNDVELPEIKLVHGSLNKSHKFQKKSSKEMAVERLGEKSPMSKPDE